MGFAIMLHGANLNVSVSTITEDTDTAQYCIVVFVVVVHLKASLAAFLLQHLLCFLIITYCNQREQRKKTLLLSKLSSRRGSVRPSN